MTILKLAAAALLMCMSTVGRSQTSPEDHAAHHPPEKATLATAPAKNDLAATRELLERAEHAKSPADRERLLDEHLAAMRKQLAALESQQCEMGKMEDGAKPGMMDEGMKMADGMKKDHMMMCHQMMKARMDTVVELLEQTWRRDELRKTNAK
jgi:hypothetical protein